MKNKQQNPQANNPRKNPDSFQRGNIPDVRDNLDSRKNEEQEFKGDDVTHNEKDTKKDKHKKHED